MLEPGESSCGIVLSGPGIVNIMIKSNKEYSFVKVCTENQSEYIDIIFNCSIDFLVRAKNRLNDYNLRKEMSIFLKYIQSRLTNISSMNHRIEGFFTIYFDKGGQLADYSMVSSADSFPTEKLQSVH